ncbi:hypothetical protein Srot_0865 [Segniliparus rotundus DSM 44985]|uniref:Uncharacterized protein n=1 Tax=Segniliparus rotundus (strain ATCC BAA-972 / CDC 1076 / CIP 108378 / DSM 44985 / JCM 13578) TaxID=640132 RepID=D6ZE62_SEGRD|nr:hypothetical protein [Segniliparus rotundus]ADG97342.1 hypothetical protein Srot_0865 [Segniliparus rotundus DSM 44985]
MADVGYLALALASFAALLVAFRALGSQQGSGPARFGAFGQEDRVAAKKEESLAEAFDRDSSR